MSPLSVNDSQSIRPFLAALERQGALLRIDKMVDPCFELSAFLSAADAGPALCFERIKGSNLRIAGNLFNGRERIAAALGIGVGEILPRLRAAIEAPLAPAAVADAPAHSVVLTENPLILLFRETPLHFGHIELMANVTRFGAIVMPPVPTFYTRPATVEELATQTAARALEVLGIEVPALKRWPVQED